MIGQLNLPGQWGPDRRQSGPHPTVFFKFSTKHLRGSGVGSPLDANLQFHFGPLRGDDITVAVAAGLIALLLLELAKRLMQPFFSVRHPQTGIVNR